MNDTRILYAVPGGNLSFDPIARAIVGCEQTVTAADIPAQIDGIPVTAIAQEAFRDCKALTRVAIPDSVTKLGEYAFCGCSQLTAVVLPRGVTDLPDCIFCDCTNLMNVTLPNGITRIGAAAFGECTHLPALHIPDSVTEIELWAFADCECLTAINIPDKVEAISAGAFENCKQLEKIEVSPNNPDYCSIDGILFTKDRRELILFPMAHPSTSYEIPDGVTTIIGWAFDKTSLHSLTLSDSVTEIAEDNFHAEHLEKIEVSPNHPKYCSIDGVLFTKDRKKLVVFPMAHPSTSYTIPDGVTEIAAWAFYGTSLHQLTIPDSVTQIGHSAFASGTNLTAVRLPNGLTKMEVRTFEGCPSLTAVQIPDSVTKLGHSAFYGCTALTRVNIPAGVTAIREGTFSGCENLTDLYYNGSRADWAKVKIETDNDPLEAAVLHCR